VTFLQLTVTETWWVEECAKAESLAAAKLRAYQQMCQDPQLRQLCQDLESRHRRRVDMIADATVSG